MNAFTTVANACSLMSWGVTNPKLYNNYLT